MDGSGASLSGMSALDSFERIGSWSVPGFRRRQCGGVSHDRNGTEIDANLEMHDAVTITFSPPKDRRAPVSNDLTLEMRHEYGMPLGPEQPGRSQVAGSDVFGELRRLAESLNEEEEEQQHGTVAGHLGVAEPGEIKIYWFDIEDGAAEFRPVGEEAPAGGDKRATAIFENLAMDARLCDMPCETAVRFLHTLASRIAETVASAGKRDRCVMDMVMFAESGGARRLKRNREAIGALDVCFRPYYGELSWDGNGRAQ